MKFWEGCGLDCGSVGPPSASTAWRRRPFAFLEALRAHVTRHGFRPPGCPLTTCGTQTRRLSRQVPDFINRKISRNKWPLFSHRGVSSMPTSSACSMTKANLPGMARLRLSDDWHHADRNIHFVNWVKVSSFLALTEQHSLQCGVDLVVVMTGELPPAEAKQPPMMTRQLIQHRGKNAFEMKGTELPSRVFHALERLLSIRARPFPIVGIELRAVEKGSLPVRHELVRPASPYSLPASR